MFLPLVVDPRFPNDHRVTLHFEKGAQPAADGGHPLQSPLVKIEPVTSIAKYDSLENFDDGKFFNFVPKSFDANCDLGKFP